MEIKEGGFTACLGDSTRLILGRLGEGQVCRVETRLKVSGLNESVRWDSKDPNS